MSDAIWNNQGIAPIHTIIFLDFDNINIGKI